MSFDPSQGVQDSGAIDMNHRSLPITPASPFIKCFNTKRMRAGKPKKAGERSVLDTTPCISRLFIDSSGSGRESGCLDNGFSTHLTHLNPTACSSPTPDDPAFPLQLSGRINNRARHNITWARTLYLNVLVSSTFVPSITIPQNESFSNTDVSTAAASPSGLQRLKRGASRKGGGRGGHHDAEPRSKGYDCFHRETIKTYMPELS